MKRFPYSAHREKGRFVARCPKADLIGHGDSIREAEMDLKGKLEDRLCGMGKRRNAGREPKRPSTKSGLKSLPRASKKLPF